MSVTEIRDLFGPFGEIIDIDIKAATKTSKQLSAYSFVQYADIISVVSAIAKMDGQRIGTKRIQVGAPVGVMGMN